MTLELQTELDSITQQINELTVRRQAILENLRRNRAIWPNNQIQQAYEAAVNEVAAWKKRRLSDLVTTERRWDKQKIRHTSSGPLKIAICPTKTGFSCQIRAKGLGDLAEATASTARRSLDYALYFAELELERRNKMRS